MSAERTIEDVRAAYRNRVKQERVKAPRLAAIAAWINSLANGYTATCGPHVEVDPKHVTAVSKPEEAKR